MSAITTHVLDTASGRPAEGIPVTLELQVSDRVWTEIARGTTDVDGRVRTLLQPNAVLSKGVYRLTFQTETYQKGFYPYVCLVFRVEDASQHYHVPLLLSPYGYTTYRGS